MARRNASLGRLTLRGEDEFPRRTSLVAGFFHSGSANASHFLFRATNGTGVARRALSSGRAHVVL
jgi:hypothetical protein